MAADYTIKRRQAKHPPYGLQSAADRHSGRQYTRFALATDLKRPFAIHEEITMPGKYDIMIFF